MQSLAKAGAAYLRHCRVTRGLSGHSLDAYGQDLGELYRFIGASRAPSCVDRDVIVDYVQHLREARRLGPRTVKRRLACLKAFFKWLETEAVIAVTPFQNLKLNLRLPKQLPRYLPVQELRALIGGTGGNNGFRRLAGAGPTPELTTRLAILFMVATGVRVGELVRITPGDINIASGAVRILGKGSRERTVFVTNAILLQMLRGYMDARNGADGDHNSPLLVNRDGRPLSAQALRLRLASRAEKAGIERRVTPHMLRHTAATQLLEAGVDIRFVQRLLGHHSLSTTEIYTHVTDTSLRQALARADTLKGLGGTYA
jgi:integrase/recombinase XerD